MSMALRWVYRKIPADKRTCVVCGKTIDRNAYIENGNLYHFGCYNLEKGKKFKCVECLGECNGLETPMVDGVRACPHCGNVGTLRNMWWWKHYGNKPATYY